MKQYRQYEDEVLLKLQNDERSVIKKVDELCKKHGIRYFAIAGTLLGAIRHKGFIPWDDDVDLGMLREDYEKFISIPKEEFEGFDLYDPSINPGRFYSFVPKFFYKQSKFVSPISYADNNMSMGIFVEIFPFDATPDDESEFEQQKKHVKRLKEKYLCATLNNFIAFEKGPVGFAKIMAKKLLKNRLIRSGETADSIAKEYVRRTTDSRVSEYVAEYADTPIKFKREWFEETVEVPFDDIMINIPKYYEGMLEAYYGSDYMTPLPPDERWNQTPSIIQFMDGETIDFEAIQD